MRDILVAASLFVLCCGPGLNEQQGLAKRVKLASTSCKTQPLRCQSADLCAKRAQTAENSIQLVQEARSHGRATPDLEADAAGSYAAADVACKAGGWR